LCPRDMRHAITQELDAACPAVLDEEARRVSLGADRQVRAAARWAQIGGRRAPAPPPVGGVLEGPRAFLLAVVEIVVGRQAGLDRGRYKAIPQFPLDRLVGNAQRSAAAVECIAAALLVFRLPEIGQNAVPVPARAAALAPQTM